MNFIIICVSDTGRMIIMVKKIQYGKELTLTDKTGVNNRILRYYLTESPVGFGYSELKNYGIEVECTERKPGMQDMRECKSIDGIFFDVEEALSFLAVIKKKRVMPAHLTSTLEQYIKEKIKLQREKSSVSV